MKRTCSPLLLAAAFAVFTLLLSFASANADTVEIIVEKNPTDPSHFTDIQTAINHANDLLTAQTNTSTANNYLVRVEPGIYFVNGIIMKSDIPLFGRETARTFLNGSGSGPIITSSGAINAGIHNFTFVNATTGIQVSNNTAVLNISNNVFQVGTGISLSQSSSTEIINNTFFKNTTAITSDLFVTKIYNNIFSNNTTAISGTAIISANVQSNDFFKNTTNAPFAPDLTTNFVDPVDDSDPLFVSPLNNDYTLNDFHVQDTSPCIDGGDPVYPNSFDPGTSDIGAYGGPLADSFPFPVSGLSATVSSPTTIDLAWSPNLSYLVTSGGGYFVHYGYASGVYNGTDESSGEQPSPIDAGSDPLYQMIDLSHPLPSLTASSSG